MGQVFEPPCALHFARAPLRRARPRSPMGQVFEPCASHRARAPPASASRGPPSPCARGSPSGTCAPTRPGTRPRSPANTRATPTRTRDTRGPNGGNPHACTVPYEEQPPARPTAAGCWTLRVACATTPTSNAPTRNDPRLGASHSEPFFFWQPPRWSSQPRPRAKPTTSPDCLAPPSSRRRWGGGSHRRSEEDLIAPPTVFVEDLPQ